MTESRLVISGASGDLGKRTTAALLQTIDPARLTLATRNPETVHAAARAASVKTVHADFNDPASLEAAYAGNDVLFLISGLAVTRRVPEHRNAIEAARRAGIRHIIYTSTAGIHPQNPTLSARDHAVTEQDLKDSGLGYTIFRCACYAEAIAENFIPLARESGTWTYLEGHGRLAPVSKEDLARCAATIMCDPDWHNGAIYEMSGSELFSFEQMTAMANEVYGLSIRSVAMSAAERQAMFDDAGVPRTYTEGMDPHPIFHLWASDEMMSADRGFAGGFHEIQSGHVRMISGQPPIALRTLLEEYRDGKRG